MSRRWILLASLGCFLVLASCARAAAAGEETVASLPPALDGYGDDGGRSGALLQVLTQRAAQEPLNLAATLLFLGAILHTFLAPKFLQISHRWQHAHAERIAREGRTAEDKPQANAVDDVSFRVAAMHFLGEIEVVFGLWVVPLGFVIVGFKGWPAARDYVGHGVDFTEPLFVVIILAIAATRPVLRFAEGMMGGFADIFGGTPLAWWATVLTVGPLLGSFITEPAAMTLCALLLGRKFYELRPSATLAYGTLGLLFVNISVGGTLTNFAAPPVLIVAERWGWSTGHMFFHFGLKAAVGIALSTALYLLIFRREFAALAEQAAPSSGAAASQRAMEEFRRLRFGWTPPIAPDPVWERRTDSVPFSITLVHLFFLAWTVFNAHSPALFVGGFLFFLAFTSATEHHQNSIALKPALLVGFFLAGLVVHGGLQGWWIEPILSRLGELPLLFGATALTAFNDNAAITYLASLVPDFSDALKHAVVAGAVAGGGLTVIANAPNPAGQSLLARYFPDGTISPLRLLLGAALPTAVMLALFLFWR